MTIHCVVRKIRRAGLETGYEVHSRVHACVSLSICIARNRNSGKFTPFFANFTTILPVMAPGRRADAVWQHFNRLPIQIGKTGVRTTCKICGMEMQGIVQRMLKHREKCRGNEGGVEVVVDDVDQDQDAHGAAVVDPVPGPAPVPQVQPVQPVPAALNQGQHPPGQPPAKVRKVQGTLTQNIIRTTPDMKVELDKSVSRMIYATNSAFRTVEHGTFKDMIDKLRPGYKPPTRYDVGGKYLIEIYEEERAKVKHFLKGETVCMSLDGWSNVHNDPIVCCTVTTSTAQVFLVDTVDTSGHPHTGEYLYDVAKACIEKTERDFGCIIGSIVTDNAANVNLMRTLLLERENRTLVAYGCSPHLLDLLSEALEFGNIKEHVNAIIKYFRNNHFASAKYKRFGVKKLVSPSGTRWNTMSDCLSVYLENWHVIFQICDENRDTIDATIRQKVGNIALKRASEELLARLKPVAVALDKTQSDKCTIADSVVIWKRLLTEIEDLNQRNATRIVEDRYEMAVTDTHLLAYLLHPKYRGEDLTADEKARAFTCAAGIPGLMPLIVQFEAKVGPFRPERFQADVIELPAAHWWKACRLPDGIAHDFIKSLMTAVAASAGVERVFSSYGIVHSKLRNRLGTEKAGKLVFVFKTMNMKPVYDEDY